MVFLCAIREIPSDPELFHDRTLPFISVMVTIVLLKDA